MFVINNLKFNKMKMITLCNIIDWVYCWRYFVNNSFRENLVKIKIASKTKALFVDFSLRAEEDDLLNFIASVLLQESMIVHLQTEQVSSKMLINFGKKLKALCAQFNSTFVVVGRADIAFGLDAEGLLLREEDISIVLAKEILGNNIFLGGFDCENSQELDYCCSLKEKDLQNKCLFKYKQNLSEAVQLFDRV